MGKNRAEREPERLRRFLQLETPQKKLKEVEENETVTRKVAGIIYEPTPSMKYSDKTNIMVTYKLKGAPYWAKTWLCVEYTGGARWYAEQFFSRRGLRCPHSAIKGVRKLERRAQIPTEVELDLSGEYPRVIGEHFAWQDIEGG